MILYRADFENYVMKPLTYKVHGFSGRALSDKELAKVHDATGSHLVIFRKLAAHRDSPKTPRVLDMILKSQSSKPSLSSPSQGLHEIHKESGG